MGAPGGPVAPGSGAFVVSGQAIPGYGVPGQAAAGYGVPGQAGPGQAAPGYAPAGPPFQHGYGQQYPGYGYQPPAGRDPALAEWWRRLLGRLIDFAIIGIFFVPFWISPWRTYLGKMRQVTNSYPAGTPLTSIPGAQQALGHAFLHFLGAALLLSLLYCLVTFGYDWIQHAIWGQTIGKRALGTIVVTADGHSKIGSGPACGRAAVFALIPLIPLLGGMFALVNELWLTWDRRTQCLHDKAAHTVVVHKRYLGSPVSQPGTW